MATTGNSAAPSRCLYEILGVGRDCSGEAIRSAYKRLAIQLHPDKLAISGLSPEAATAKFQDLLHAYQVLSDPKERQWYDAHRSQILFSSPSPSSASAFGFGPGLDLDLSAAFSPSAFSGYSDTGRGFYKVYSDLFTRIYQNELFYCSRLGLCAGEVPPPPLMGSLSSPYDQATAFYGYWLGFSTVMDFSWADAYDCVGPDRRSRRAMEKENRKVRSRARWEYNDTVRGLAAYVKKRDKRVMEMQVKRKEAEAKRKAEMDARKKKEEMRKVETARMYQEPEWTKVDGDQNHEDHEDDEAEEENGRKHRQELYCVVCCKKFKSDKQWKNHEQSKKHRERVAELRESFIKEDADSGQDDVLEEEVRVEFDYVPQMEEEESDSSVDVLCEELKVDLELDRNESIGNGEDNIDEKNGDNACISEAMASGTKNKKKKDYVPIRSATTADADLDTSNNTSMEYNMQKKNGRNRHSRRRATAKTDDDTKGAQRETTEIEKEDHVEEHSQEYNADDTREDATNKENVAARKNHKQEKPLDGVKGGKKGTNVESKNLSKGKKMKRSSRAPSNSCETCGENFDTRNKLFAHLGDTGHATLKTR